MKILSVVGTRPNLVKIAPLMKEFSKHPEVESILVHTGQHYDIKMNDIFFEDLDIPEPQYNLGVGSKSHAVQIGRIMSEFEKVCLLEKPDLVLVVGDVNSTLACALVASKLNIKLAHVEAGLRSFDRTMPEEINRLLTDAISDCLFITEPAALENLRKENIPESKIFFVGNVMIDSLIASIERIKKSQTYKKYNLPENSYVVVTLHRPSNVDDENKLSAIINALDHIQKRMKIIWPIHPRTKKNLERFKLDDKVNSMENLLILEPLNYIDFMNLVLNCKFVLTDSGGIQEETTYLGKPCITLRKNTERLITIDIGTNTLAEIEDIIVLFDKVLSNTWKKGKIPDLWDGKTAERIVKKLLEAQKS